MTKSTSNATLGLIMATSSLNSKTKTQLHRFREAPNRQTFEIRHLNELAGAHDPDPKHQSMVPSACYLASDFEAIIAGAVPRIRKTRYIVS